MIKPGVCLKVANIRDASINVIKEVYTEGIDSKKDDSSLRELITNEVFISDPFEIGEGNYGLLSEEKILDLIKSGKFDMKNYPIKGEALDTYVRSFDDPDSTEDFVYSYPLRLRKWGKEDVEQFDSAFKRLNNNLSSNRSIMVTYDPSLDVYPTTDIPCLIMVQFFVRDNKLYICPMFRSNDAYGAFYSNMFFIAYMGFKMFSNLNKNGHNVEWGGIRYQSTSLHIYSTDFPQVEEFIKGIK